MAMVKGVAAALLVLSMSPALACDDFDDDKALAAAIEAAKLAQTRIPQQASGAGAAVAAAAGQPTPPAVAAVGPMPTGQASETSTGTVRR